MLVEATIGKMVTRLGGAACAARHWFCPRYEPPCMATLPLDQRLLRRPLDRVVAVLLVVEERLPAAFRLVAPADVLEDVDVAALREVDGGVVGGGEALGAVRRSRDEDRITAVSDRPIDVGVQDDAVAHRNRHAVVEQDVVPRRDVGRRKTRARRGAEPPADRASARTAEEAGRRREPARSSAISPGLRIDCPSGSYAVLVAGS